MNNAVGIGFGKAILFGDHFVVYGLPGIASSIELNTTCTYAKNLNGIISNDLVTGEIIRVGEDKEKTLDRVISAILKETGIKERNFRLDLKTNMSLKGGMGSSAALIVSITRCLNGQFSLGLDDEQVNRVAFEAEKVFHKTPSGIDNSVSCFGGMIWFVKKQSRNLIERLHVKPVEAVLSDTGISHDTAQAVQMVRAQKEADENKYAKIFSDYLDIANAARAAVEKADWKTVGLLMNENQKLLQQINVSSAENDLLVQTALGAGALGAKVTGAGLGGNNIALTPGKALQEKVAKACEKEGFKAYKVKVGVRV